MDSLALWCYQHCLVICKGHKKLDSFHITSEARASSSYPEFISMTCISLGRKDPYHSSAIEIDFWLIGLPGLANISVYNSNANLNFI